MKILITGSDGFVGRAVCDALTGEHTLVRATRKQIGDLNEHTDWRALLAGCDAVVHLAARVHVPTRGAMDEMEAFRRVNVEGTLNLARQAAQAGVKRFVFMSSVMVHGRGRATPYRETDMPRPEDAYGLSKWEAELRLQELARQTSMELVVLRPPLVYGPGVKANFARLMEAVARCLPLPLGGVRNQRSLIYVGNLADAVRLCLSHADAAGKTYLVSDGEDVSTPELARRIAHAMARPALLIPVPARVCRWAGWLIGKTAEVDRLLGSLSVHSEAIRRELGWKPPFSMAQGLEKTTHHRQPLNNNRQDA